MGVEIEEVEYQHLCGGDKHIAMEMMVCIPESVFHLFKINVRLWNATAQRCTGKSKVATMANREIERVLLLLQKRFNELSDMQDVVTAEEVRNVFQDRKSVV